MADEIVLRYERGETCRQICAHEHLPVVTTLYRWMREGVDDLKQRIDRAQPAHAQSLMDIAMERGDAAHDVNTASAARVQSHILMSTAARIDRARWGDTKDVTVTHKREVSPAEVQLALIKGLMRHPQALRAALERHEPLRLIAREALAAIGGACAGATPGPPHAGAAGGSDSPAHNPALPRYSDSPAADQ